MGHAGFMSIGAYTSAFFTLTLLPDSSPLPELLFLFSLIVGSLSAGLVGILLGLPILRLKGDYLAMVTLGFGEIIRVVINNQPWLGGARGLNGIRALTTLGWVFAIASLSFLFLLRLKKQAFGRSCRAVRDDEIAAQAMGVKPTQIKVMAFTLGASLAGLAGGLFAHTLQYLNPQSFDFNKSFEAIIMVVLGGSGSFLGSVLAAICLTGNKELLRMIQEWTQLDFRMIFYASMLITLMLVRPQGFCGTKEWDDFKK